MQPEADNDTRSHEIVVMTFCPPELKCFSDALIFQQVPPSVKVSLVQLFRTKKKLEQTLVQ